MPKQSAGLAVYRIKHGTVEVLLGHPGGPFWAKKDIKGWSFPKGEVDHEGDDLLETAKREFEEEIGQPAPAGKAESLGSVKASSGKTIHIWAVEGDLDVSTITSNTFMLEWPPKSGQQLEIPEIDRADWFTLSEAIPRLHQNQADFIPRLIALLKPRFPELELETTASDDSTQASLF
jgi:predicted NUDIX family NTP pyrophosphohydrolase